MTVLVLAETSKGVLSLDATARTVMAVAPLGAVTLLVCGPADVAREAAGIAGVAQVLHSDDQRCVDGLAEDIAKLVLANAHGMSTIAAPATSLGKSVLPRLAAMLDAMVISDVIEVLGPDTFKRPIYAGNAIQTVRSSDDVRILTVRTSVFAPAEAEAGTAAMIRPATPAEPAELTRFLGESSVASGRPDLSSAKVVVSGGRGVGSAENFALIEDLADILGAAVGASRAAVDSGYAPNDRQVGQTGKVVAPDLYVAIGISGAIQHLAGMKDSKVIVAINKDEDAPIFQVADYGLVADLFEATPELKALLA